MLKETVLILLFSHLWKIFRSLQRRFSQVVFGHGRQLLGLAVHPEEEIFATAGCDKNVALWRKQKLLWTCHSGYECVSLAFHPFGAALAVGSTEGHLLVLNAENGSTMITLRVCGSPLNCISYNQGKKKRNRISLSLSLFPFRTIHVLFFIHFQLAI